MTVIVRNVQHDINVRTYIITYVYYIERYMHKKAFYGMQLCTETSNGSQVLVFISVDEVV